MAEKVNKSEFKTLVELSFIMRYEKLPPFNDGFVTSKPNGSGKKRLKMVQQNLRANFNGGVSDICKMASNALAMGIHAKQMGDQFAGLKMIRTVLEAKGCDDRFIRRVMSLAGKFPKLVLCCCWPSSELMSDHLYGLWLPGWGECETSPGEVKAATCAADKT